MPFNRTYICQLCGALRRSPAHYVVDGATPPQCCRQAMEMLSYEQSSAVGSLAADKRVRWWKLGGKIVQKRGKYRPAISTVDRQRADEDG